jgi:hypothetical protein
VELDHIKFHKKQVVIDASRTTRLSNISSRKRVNQMLRRDKQIQNLHKNGHHVDS